MSLPLDRTAEAGRSTSHLHTLTLFRSLAPSGSRNEFTSELSAICIDDASEIARCTIATLLGPGWGNGCEAAANQSRCAFLRTAHRSRVLAAGDAASASTTSLSPSRDTSASMSPGARSRFTAFDCVCSSRLLCAAFGCFTSPAAPWSNCRFLIATFICTCHHDHALQPRACDAAPRATWQARAFSADNRTLFARRSTPIHSISH